MEVQNITRISKRKIKLKNFGVRIDRAISHNKSTRFVKIHVGCIKYCKKTTSHTCSLGGSHCTLHVFYTLLTSFLHDLCFTMNILHRSVQEPNPSSTQMYST